MEYLSIERVKKRLRDNINNIKYWLKSTDKPFMVIFRPYRNLNDRFLIVWRMSIEEINNPTLEERISIYDIEWIENQIIKPINENIQKGIESITFELVT